MTGTVIEAGGDVADVRVDDRVVVNGCLTCGECRWCTSGEEVQCPSMAGVGFAIDGGLAEQTVWRASQVVRLPDNVSSEEAALVEPSAVAMHAVRRSRLQKGERAAVLGVGTVGMMAMQEAKALGAQVYAVDRRQMSLDLAAQLGADAVINPETQDAGEALRDLTDGDGPDVIIDAAGGRDTPALATQWVRAGGRVLLVAIFTAKTQIDFNSVVGREVELIGSIAYQQRDIEQVVSMISSGAITTAPLISDRISLEDVFSKGYERMMAPTKDVFKILVAPSGVPG
jgi:(R,R)-butanediol dehydrogenase/meso-butanediol dehydrogenase/diacetyl reductase